MVQTYQDLLSSTNCDAAEHSLKLEKNTTSIICAPIIIIIIIGLKLQSLTGTKFQQTLQAGTTTFDSFYIEIMQDPKTQFIKRLDMFGNIKWGQRMWGNKNKMGNIK